MPSFTIRDIPEPVLDQAIAWLAAAEHWLSEAERSDLVNRIRESRDGIERRRGISSDSTEILRRMRARRGNK